MGPMCFFLPGAHSMLKPALSTIHSTAARSRALSSQAPIAWNSLPAKLRAERNSENFKKN